MNNINVRRFSFRGSYDRYSNRTLCIKKSAAITRDEIYNIGGRIQDGTRGKDFVATVTEKQYAMLKRKFKKLKMEEA